jgi:SAM-dependent methyltransferase
VFDQLQYKLLKKIAKPRTESPDDRNATYRGGAKLSRVLGPDLLSQAKDKIVIDFGCGYGYEAIDLVHAGATHVYGLDIRDKVLQHARRLADAAGLSQSCTFTTRIPPETRADVIVSIDAFEHFEDPAATLVIMHRLLRDDGKLFVSFGPTWYHPLGGHVFSVFPWAHLIMSERALIRWRSDFENDGATKFGELADGLNQMTVRRFEQLIARSPFRAIKLEGVPIRKFAPIHCNVTREFTTSIVRGFFVKRAVASPLLAEATLARVTAATE